MMTSRQRVLEALNHKQPDRLPIFVTLTPQVAAKLSKALNLPYEEPLDSLLSTRISHTRLLTHLGNDCVGIATCVPATKPTYTDESFPLANAETEADIQTYSFIQADDPTRISSALQTIKEYGEDYAVVADIETTLLSGLENYQIGMMLKPGYLNHFLDKMMEVNMLAGKELIKAGADMIWAGDDFGSQSSMIMDSNFWRTIFKPRIKYMFEEFRKVNPDIKIAWYTCGSILPVIPDFIEMGLNVLNPLQPMASLMDPLFLKNEYGKYLSFFGAISVHDLFTSKTPNEIKTEVKRRAKILGRNGGYIISPVHNIPDDCPVENILAFFEAVKELSD
jgi:uroporphyrinogen decarboxylase